MNSIGFTTNGQLSINGVPRSFSSHNAYNLISGGMSLTNSVITAGMATTLYTGNGTTQSVVTGVDMATQWGNSASETFGGLVWGKSRSNAFSNQLYDTVRGATQMLISDLTNADTVVAQGLTSFNNNGFSIGNTAGLNTNLATQASWNFQTTHRITGTTNHGKAYTCHYNPFTGFTMIKYEGSGLAGHEIPHHLGRKLGFWSIKNTSVVIDWISGYQGVSGVLGFNTTGAYNGAIAGFNTNSDIAISVDYLGGAHMNASTNQYIMYGWANSYFDEANTLIGNYEVGVYQGTGATGNKVTTRGKPAWVMIKSLTAVGSWQIVDNLRGDKQLFANTSSTEDSFDLNNITSDGIVFNTADSNSNAAGVQYLYMVVYDNDSGSGKSKYNKATDTSALSLTATVPFANGLDTNGTKNTVLTFNETLTGLTYTQGKNYVYKKNDGTTGVTNQNSQIGSYNGFGDYFDVNKNQWYQSTSVFSDDFSTDTSWGVSNITKSIVNGEIVAKNSTTAYGYIYKNFTTVVGKKYRITFKFTSCTNIQGCYLGVGSGIGSYDTASYTVMASGSAYTREFTATVTNTYVYLMSANNAINEINTYDDFAIYPINNDGSVDITSATPITESRNYLDAIVYADAGGQPTFVEQLPKIEYKDVVKANEYQGKNACTAWVNFDGTTTPPTIRDSFNVSAVIRTGTGVYDVYFKTPMDNANYVNTFGNDSNNTLHSDFISGKTLVKFTMQARLPTNQTPTNSANITIHTDGGRN